MNNDRIICPGCGAVFNAEDGPTHRYMTSSPACWRHFGDILAAEYSNDELRQIHRVSVDTYAIQHPGDGSRRAIQSVGLHLARLSLQLTRGLPPAETNDVMLGLTKHKASLIKLTPPAQFSMTVADVAPYAGSSRHETLVHQWARSAFEDWKDNHEYIKDWILSTGLF